MNGKISYNECIAFIEDLQNIKLHKYQIEIVKDICEGKEIRFGRGMGRSFITENYLNYLAYVYDKNIYDETPELLMSYESFMSGDS
jgi:hypothetical protein